jgi:outer membrane receptor for ferrienterochelin and colicins
MAQQFQLLFILIFIFCTTGSKLAAQGILFKDADSGAPMITMDVSLTEHISGKEVYVRTDDQGRIILTDESRPLKSPLKVEASYLGYLPVQTLWDANSDLIIEMKMDPLLLNTMVVTAQYQPKSVSAAVQNIKVISRNQLDRMAAVNLRDALIQQLNIRISEDNILGSGLRIQGLSGENVKIMIDGVPLIGRLDGDLDLRQINLDQIERIEIVEGPLSVQYGTNALAGTINLISRKNSGSGIGLGYYAENVGTQNISLRAHHAGGNHTIGIFGSRNIFDGWHPGDSFIPDFRRHIGDSTRFKSWKPREQHSLGANYSLRLGRTILGAKTQYFNECILNRGLPRRPYQESAFDDTYKTQRMDLSVNAEGFLTDLWRVNVVAAFNHYEREKNTFIKNLTNLESVLSSNPADHDTTVFVQWMSRGSLQKLPGTQNLGMEIGYDIQLEQSAGLRIDAGLREITDLAVFATAEYEFADKWIFKPGLRAAYNSAYQAPLVPSLHLKGGLGPVSIRASWAKGFRAPSIKELYFYFVDINHNIIGNPSLKAEYSDNYSLNLKGTHQRNNLNFDWEAAVFYNQMQNLITLAQLPSTAEFTYINVGKFISKGIQSSVSISHQSLSIALGGSITGLYNQISETATVDEFSYSPELNSVIGYEYSSWSAGFQLMTRYQGRQPGFNSQADGTIAQTFIDPYWLTDLSIYKNLFGKQFLISLGCKNIFNVNNVNSGLASSAHSSNAGSVPIGMGRILFVKLDYSIQLKKK